jgi:CRISPR-associated endonuclease/helicase Cas3
MSSLYYNEVWSHPNKPLREHLEKVAEITKCSIEDLPLNLPVEKTILSEILYYLGLYHDIGKATPFFQEYLREENEDKKARLKNDPKTKHSLLSAVATYFAIEEYLKEINFDNDFSFFLPVAGFIAVRRHHTDLQSVSEDIRLDESEVIKEQINNLYVDYLSFLPNWKEVYAKLKTLPEGWPLKKLSWNKWLGEDKGVLPYLIQHLFYSLLLDADKHEATVGTKLERKILPSNMVELYRKKEGLDVSKSKINNLRNEIYQRVIGQVEAINLEKEHILSLSAPTGSGKTLTSFAFALNLREKIKKEKGYCPRIIYCLPYLSIIDQNAKVIEQVFKIAIEKEPPSDYFLIHHHLSEYSYKREDSEYGPEESEILIEGWDSEVIITTFVQLFQTLFTNKKRAIRKFHKLLGSIVILDKVQSFPHTYWSLFKETAQALAEYFNVYFILSTATQPAIFDCYKELVKEKEKYFSFMKRTQVLVKTFLPMTINELNKYILESLTSKPQSTLIVLNTINSAQEVFKGVRDTLKKEGFEVYYLSSHIVPMERLRRIEKIKKSSHRKVVISTQLVEAGVDIDLERVIRDIGPFDSISQVAGRANRNYTYEDRLADVEIVILKNERDRFFSSYIYDPVLIDATQRLLQQFTQIPEDCFLNLCIKYYKEVKRLISDDESIKYLDGIKKLDYEYIGNFKLIKEEIDKIDIFIELDDEATEVWERYQELLEIKDIKTRRIEFLKIRKNFYSYVISVFLRKAYKNLPPEIGGIRFVSRTQLEEFYDCETGFKFIPDCLIW